MNTTQPELPPNPEAGAQQQAATPAPAAGEVGGPIRGELSHLISWLTEASCQAANAGRLTDAGMLCWAAQVASERVDEDAPAPPAPADPTKMAAPPAEWEDLATSLQNCGTWLIEIGYASEQVNTRDMGIKVVRAAALLQQQAEELAECREALRRVRLEQRIPGGFW